MKTHLRFDDAALEQLPVELQDLWQIIDGKRPDREKLVAAFGRVAELVRRQCRILNLVQDNMASLRHNTEHLAFDLEATRRERDALQDRMDQNPFQF
jgi:hypothetical protein